MSPSRLPSRARVRALAMRVVRAGSVRALVASAALGAGAALPGAAVAQGGEITNVVGVVRGPSGAALVGAEVVLTPKLQGQGVTMGRRTVTDDSGRFVVPSIPHGTATIAVRRIGYRPTTIETPIPSPVALAFLLETAPVQLAKVVVQDRKSQYQGPLAPFLRRRDQGFGRFITRDDIEKRNAIRTTDLLRTVPGVMVGPSRGGFSQTVRIRANNCSPLVWLDGTPALAGYLDIDSFDPNTLDGIEIYSGLGSVPVELRGPRGEERCGVIALWSRVVERRPRKSKKKPVTADELASLVASATVYTAEQVDQPAQADSSSPLTLFYPEQLKAAKIPGHVVLEFVVDTLGQVETETIGVVLATHPRFAEAARSAVWNAQFSPAVRQGRRVRQVVQLPVDFTVSAR